MTPPQQKTGEETHYEAVVVGGGFAGLTAALWLGRFHRRTLVLSAGPSRNAPAQVAHGYPGFDGANPGELLDKLEAEVDQYPSVTRRTAWVDTAAQDGDQFCITAGELAVTADRVVLATGIRDVQPDLPGFADYEGRSIWHCPACDGYEYTGKPIVVVGNGEHVAGYAQELMPYADPLTIVTLGSTLAGSAEDLAALAPRGIEVHEQAIHRLHGADGQLEAVELADGTVLEAAAVFYSLGHEPLSELAKQLGCEVGAEGLVVDRRQETTTTGVYAAGDLAPLEELVVVAAAMGAVAANNLHQSLGPGS
ncbi:NAD(P)/FAD-dependent oxidoreductase [Rhodococcus sp. X156]|uniref:NAD(P)/FAD-dependent oxidoreductase n=1 Tax=Rhodococcus sp. X156 TaxID=2499145 RepID=UPI000FDB028B|nr:NAD(P)/FAD-dependent oxidoreductase [Rhodococcus sp. X156]